MPVSATEKKDHQPPSNASELQPLSDSNGNAQQPSSEENGHAQQPSSVSNGHAHSGKKSKSKRGKCSYVKCIVPQLCPRIKC